MSPSLIQILILGVVQGAAELLPVSSSAHVIAAEKLMRLDPSSPEMTLLIVMLHTGTMLAMIAYFWKSWRKRFFADRRASLDSLLQLALATAATGAVGFGLKLLIEKVVLGGRPGAEVEELFSNLPLVAVSLAAAGILIVAAGVHLRKAGNRDPSVPAPLTAPASVAIGVVQGVCLPFRGLSRSGTTISCGLLLGVQRRVAEEFSFALAVIVTPPLIIREVLRLYRARALAGARVDLAAMAVPGLAGMLFSFGAGLAALAWLSGWLEKGRWQLFGYYCFTAAAGVGAMACLGY
jgi:undecaprenyl-diphosphatase